VIVVGSMISLGYYLRVIAAIWMREAPGPIISPQNARPLLAGGSPEADTAGRHLEVVFVAFVFAAATVFFGIVPQPLFDLVHRAAGSLTGIL
jgi:NADH-quinone oxidoreductase subunit N